MTTDIQAHEWAIEECNQRGGRMLSLVDLLAAGTVDLALAAYLAAVMRSGASLLVGARPGGAGKTTVMCALLNFLPDHTAIRAVASRAVLEAALRDDGYGDTCYLAHEIGSGPYYAYVWGAQARAFLQLAALGHIIASNLHADTLAETHDQLCRVNRVPPEHLAAVHLKVYLRLRHGRAWTAQRWVSHVYENDGSGDRLLWRGEAPGVFARQANSALVSPEQEQEYAELIDELYARGVRRIGKVRRALVLGHGKP